ncbi:hypothetical protein ES703_118545 [subsurface metagenome]
MEGNEQGFFPRLPEVVGGIFSAEEPGDGGEFLSGGKQPLALPGVLHYPGSAGAYLGEDGHQFVIVQFAFYYSRLLVAALQRLEELVRGGDLHLDGGVGPVPLLYCRDDFGLRRQGAAAAGHQDIGGAGVFLKLGQ